MTVEASDFTRAMRKFPAAVNVVTTLADGERGGLTATAVFSLTATPPQVAVAVNRNASAFPLISKSGCFAINTLASGNHDIARAFAGGEKGEQRFAVGSWSALSTGAPVLGEAVLALDCKVAQTIDFSTHTLLIGDVVAYTLGATSRPLLFVDGNWANLLPASVTGVTDIEEGLDLQIAEIDKWLDSEIDSGTALSDLVRTMTAINIKQQPRTREYMGAELYAPPEELVVVNGKKRLLDERFVKLLERGIASGEFDVEDVRIARLAIEGMVAWTYRWYREEGRLGVDEIADRLARFALRAAGHREPV